MYRFLPILRFKERGVQDILITCTDNLNGFTDTIRTYSLNHPLKSVWYIRSEIPVNIPFIKDKKEFTADMKNIYNAPKKRLLPQNLTVWKRNEEESILIPYFHGETTGITWLFSSNSHWNSEKLSIPKSHWKPEQKN